MAKVLDLKEKIGDKITIKMITDGFGGLQRNGYDLVCPYVPPMQVRQRVVSNILGGQVQEQTVLQKTVCNTGCPLLRINDNSIDICCGGEPVSYSIEEIIGVADDANPNKAKEKSNGNPKIIPFGGVGGQA